MEDLTNSNLTSLYYKPKVEEFCIGFEYEFIYYDECTDRCIWKKSIFPNEFTYSRDKKGNPNLVEVFYSHLEDTRVKYLDNKDIEDLGWIHTSTNSNIWNYILNPGLNFELVYNSIDRETHIRKKITAHVSFPIGYTIINNKFELKKFMELFNVK